MISNKTKYVIVGVHKINNRDLWTMENGSNSMRE